MFDQHLMCKYEKYRNTLRWCDSNTVESISFDVFMEYFCDLKHFNDSV